MQYQEQEALLCERWVLGAVLGSFVHLVVVWLLGCLVAWLLGCIGISLVVV